jgi:hypothetical protein
VRYANLAELPEALRSRAAAELEKQGSAPGPGAKAGKYRNTRTAVGDEIFDSKLEAACFVEQQRRKSAGEARLVLRQVTFTLPGGVRYRCDFFVCLTAGGFEVLDAKGVLTKEFVIKAKQMLAVHGIDVLVWTRRRCVPFSKSRKP